MAQRSYTGAFRFAGNATDQNLSDQISATGGGVSAWSLGATIIEIAPVLSPPQNQAWKVLAVEFLAGFSVGLDTSSGPCYGKLGQLLGAIATEPVSQTPVDAGGRPWISPMLPLPNDLSLITKLYDGATDEAPPASTLTNIDPRLYVSGSLNLSQPIQLTAGQQVGVGLWMTPSLAKLGAANNGHAGLLCRRSRYTVIYDDGL